MSRFGAGASMTAGAAAGTSGGAGPGSGASGNDLAPAPAPETFAGGGLTPFDQLAIKSGLGLGTAAGGAAIAGASLATAALTAGITAAAAFTAMGITNELQCGTVTQRGCDKRDDTGEGEKIMLAVRRLAHQWHMGEQSDQNVIAYLTLLDRHMSDAQTNPFKDGLVQWTGKSFNPESECGAWLTNPSIITRTGPQLTVQPIAAAVDWSDPAFGLDCGAKNKSRQDIVRDFITLVSGGSVTFANSGGTFTYSYAGSAPKPHTSAEGAYI